MNGQNGKNGRPVRRVAEVEQQNGLDNVSFRTGETKIRNNRVRVRLPSCCSVIWKIVRFRMNGLLGPLGQNVHEIVEVELDREIEFAKNMICSKMRKNNNPQLAQVFF